MSALATVSAEIIKRARAQGYELAPWFEANQSRLRVFSSGLERILTRLPLNSDSDQKRRMQAHAQLRSAIAPLRPEEEIAWFDRNRPDPDLGRATMSGQHRAVAAMNRSAAAQAPSGAERELRATHGGRTHHRQQHGSSPASDVRPDFDRCRPRKLRRYTGWGGLSVKRAAKVLPAAGCRTSVR